MKLCKDCRFFVGDYVGCVRGWVNLVTGKPEWNSGDCMPAWQARRNYCGPTGEGWEAKETKPNENP